MEKARHGESWDRGDLNGSSARHQRDMDVARILKGKFKGCDKVGDIATNCSISDRL